MLRNRRQDDVRFVLFPDWTTGLRSLSGFSTSVSSDARDLTQSHMHSLKVSSQFQETDSLSEFTF